ncbi:hypothetical protein KSF_065900 [Reticulibacter mediterranei]|uniref:Uncharacterized protein n=1 Tax=Reticulibacter mediterranei TaxID=2778369 RepID=A0A8J3N6W5_9CHLR|nr:hypothetical protein [Reticulibacter mediterranei]GHO96542.1 hypothetical protein KSF_065900 [Reticulibacter mediterranei]
MPSVPHRSDAVEYPHRGLAVECGSIEILLSLLRHSATILLMQVERTVPQHGSWLARRAIHLTARKMEQRDSPIYYCTIPAVQFLFVGDHGQLIAPVREERATTQVTARALAVATSLQEALVASLQADARVSQILTPARYRLPDAWIWGVQTSLEGTGIFFQQDRWVHDSHHH